jgi:hypothetical protein
LIRDEEAEGRRKKEEARRANKGPIIEAFGKRGRGS